MKYYRLLFCIVLILLMCVNVMLAQDDMDIQMGTPIEYDDQWSITINGASFEYSLRDNTGTGTVRPTAGNIFLLLDVTLTNHLHPDVETSLSTSGFSSIVTDSGGNSGPKIGSGTSNYCVSGGGSICGGTTTSPNASISTNFVYVIAENPEPPYTLEFSDVDLDPITFTTEVVPPAEINLPSERIDAQNISDIEVIATFLNYHMSDINSLGISPDSQRLISSSSFGTTRIWDLVANEEVMTLSGRNASFSPVNNDLIALITYDSDASIYNIELYNMADGTSTVLGSYAERASTLQFNSDGSVLVSYGCDELRSWNCVNGIVYLYDVASGDELAVINDANWPVLSSDGTILSYREAETENVVLYNIESQETLFTVETETDRIRSAFSPDSQLIAIADTGTLNIWDTNSGEIVGSVSGYHTVMALTFAPDNMQLVVAGCVEALRYSSCENEEDRDLRVVDVASGETIKQMEMPQIVFSLGFALDDQALVIGGWGLKQYIDFESGDMLQSLSDSNYIIFNAESTLIATNGGNRVVILWGLP